MARTAKTVVGKAPNKTVASKSKTRKAKVKNIAAKSAPKTAQPTVKVGASEIPRKTLEECLIVVKPIHEVYAGTTASWDEIASTSGIGVSTANTKYLIWSAQAYGLLVKEDKDFSLSETGRKILAPNFPEERNEALLKAIMIPTVLSKFYSDYNGKLLPEGNFFDNVLENRFGIPRERTEEAKKIILSNAEYAGILTTHSNGKQTIRLEGGSKPTDGASEEQDISVELSSEELEALPNRVPVDTETSCFYITPIGEEGSEIRRHADMFLRHLVEPAFEQFNIKVIRADKIEKSGLISQQIFEYVISSKFCIADLSFGNPNAFYELGIRHMTKLPTIQIIRKGDKIPFDVAQGRTIVVDTSDIYSIMDRIESARKELVEHIKNYLDPSEKGRTDDNPVTIYLPGLQVRLPRAGTQ
jgi:hypothetical protein